MYGILFERYSVIQYPFFRQRRYYILYENTRRILRIDIPHHFRFMFVDHYFLVYDFIIRSVGEDGKVYECPVKPDRTSVKSMLNLLLSE